MHRGHASLLSYITGLLCVFFYYCWIFFFLHVFLLHRHGTPSSKVKMENGDKYLPELLAEKDSLDSSFTHAMKLLNTGKVSLFPLARCMRHVHPQRAASSGSMCLRTGRTSLSTATLTSRAVTAHYRKRVTVTVSLTSVVVSESRLIF